MSSHEDTFAQFGLLKNVLSALFDLGYERATPIQQQSIPVLLNDDDLVAQAQTGTGKTAAFALPILSRLDYDLRSPQALILVPTRELAIQVAEAFQSYAKHLRGFSVTPIYGGQDFGTQLRSLKRGSQVIVGTPGRLMDHMRRNTLLLNSLNIVVLDEADEMLKMGFADDVEWILGQLSKPHQTALFAATMPASIQKIAQRYLKDAKKIHIKSHTNTVEAIEQSFIAVSNRNQKIDVLTRLLEMEDNQGVIIFTRTKTESTELAERLQARGYSAAALNGDMSQSIREKTINRFKKGKLDVLTATDVAARGIDIDRVSHVINYDIPYDVDTYVHRIGRTGRAGRTGKAILFVTPREMRLFKDIERHIQKSIQRMEPPSLKAIREKRSMHLNKKIVSQIRTNKQAILPYVDSIMALTEKESLSAKEVAAALMYFMAEEKNVPDDDVPEVFFADKPEKKWRDRDHRHDRSKKSRRPFRDFQGKHNKHDKRQKHEKDDQHEKKDQYEKRDTRDWRDKKDQKNRKDKRDNQRKHFSSKKPDRHWSDKSN